MERQNPGKRSGMGWKMGNQGRVEEVREVTVRLSLAEFSEQRKTSAFAFHNGLQIWAWKRSSGGFWDQDHVDRRLFVISEQCLPSSGHIFATVLLATLSINTFYLNKLKANFE